MWYVLQWWETFEVWAALASVIVAAWGVHFLTRVRWSFVRQIRDNRRLSVKRRRGTGRYDAA